MYRLDFSVPVRIHFIGIGGISMSGLAEILLDRNFTVSGSDKSRSAQTARLEKKGALIFYGQKADNIPKNCDVVVYTAAIKPDNPELSEAISRGVPLLTRAELLGELMENYPKSIAVAGTHGKTTTTSMLAHILLAAGADPTVSVGGILPAIGGNIRVGSSPVFLTEACEYTNSFLSLRPLLGIILNIENDHLDFFEDIESIRSSFKRFANLIKEDGALIINSDIDDVPYFTDGLKRRVVTFSLDGKADIYASGISYDEFALPSFSICENGSELTRVALKAPGEHNVLNALAAAAAARALCIDALHIQKGLMSFNGTERRFQFKGKVNGATIIDDYAHHPTEITSTLNAARLFPHKRLICVFQPHTYSRTAAFLDGFAEALSVADEVILAEIYSAREDNTYGVSSADITERIQSLGTPCSYFATFKEIEDALLPRLKEDDILITMGAGDVNLVGEHLLEEVE